MATFSNCLKKSGLNDEEIRIYDDLVTKHQANGMPVAGAQKAAAQSRLDELGKDRADVVSKIEAAIKAEKVAEEPKKVDEGQISEPIKDVGEKIGGARKDVWSGFREKIIGEITDDEILSQPLSKLFPEPDYGKLAEQGADQESLAIIKAIRDEIPVKGRSSYKRQQYVKGVQLFKNASKDILDDPEYKKNFIDGLRENRSLKDLAERIDLMLELGFPANKEANLKDITLNKVHFSLYNGEKNVTKWVVDNHAKSKKTMGGMGGQIAAVDTREEAVSALKKYLAVEAGKPKGKRVTKFEVYKYRRDDGRGWIVGKKLGTRNQYDMKSGFKTSKEARLYIDKHQTELEEQLKKYKELPAHRKKFNDSRLGDDYRGGKDVTAEEFRDTFGFRGVEFGNWVEQQKRQADVNEAYDGLMDLAKLLGIPPKALSLNGELGMAFGARGVGGKLAPKAHYEPDKIVINLTKKDGAGSLAHEWFHGLDNYFSRMRGDKASYLTDRPFEIMDKSVRKEMIDSFRGVVDAIKATDLPKRATELDKHRTKPYWATTIEMSARSFESYIVGKLKDKELSNDYLANIVSEDYWAAAESLGLEDVDSYPYILAEELDSINNVFNKFFNVIKTKETDKGVALFSKYSRPGKGKKPKGMSVEAVQAIVKEFASEFNANVNLDFRVYQDKVSSFGAKNAREYGADTVKGAYYAKSRVLLLVASELNNKADAIATLRHELIAHHGLNLFNPEGKKRILEAVSHSRKSITLKRIWTRIDRDYADSNELERAEEVIAAIAQDKQGVFTKAWNAIVKAITNALRAIGLFKGKITKTEIRELINTMEEGLRTGKRQQTFPISDDAQFAAAFHGGPHRFEKFSMEAIGTGEGAQAYGHGLYFAESKDVAESYKQAIPHSDVKRKFLDALPEDAEIDEVMKLIGNDHFTKGQESVLNALDADDWLGFDYPSQAISAIYKDLDLYDPSPALRNAIDDISHLYEVDIPDEQVANFLDWDAPLSEQGEAIKRLGAETFALQSGMAPDHANYKSMVDLLYNQMDSKTGKDLYQEMSFSGGATMESSRGQEEARC